MPETLGSFRILALLGEGGSGTVYSAVRGDEKVALKVLRADLALSERENRRFMEEVERMRRLRHPGLVSVVDAGVLPDGRPYLAMPLLEGEPLASRLSRGKMPIDEALVTFDALADAVQALHDAGLLHRDIKPENIFVPTATSVHAPRVVLLDLGIARDVSSEASTTTQAGVVRGTPAYMAPERFFGTPASIASDVYELAVVLYAMLVGQLPWDTNKSAEARLAPVHPRDYGMELPGAVSTVLMRSISTRPEARPASARELAREVRAALTAEPTAIDTRRTADAHPIALAPTPRAFGDATTGSSTSWTEPRAQSKRKIPGFAWVAVGAALALGAGGVWAMKSRPSSSTLETSLASTAPLATTIAVDPTTLPIATSTTTATAIANATATSTSSSTSNPNATATANGPKPTAKTLPKASARDAGVASTGDPDRFYQDRR